jgi:hypothetical protein
MNGPPSKAISTSVCVELTVLRLGKLFTKEFSLIFYPSNHEEVKCD